MKCTDNINTIPISSWKPRSWQREMMGALQKGYKRILCALPRRSGKDVGMIQCALWFLLTQRIGEGHLIAPFRQTAANIWWNGLDESGRPFLFQYIPDELISEVNVANLMIKFTNGSILRLVGADNLSSLPGMSVVFAGFTEMALTNPLAWQKVYEPMLISSRGVACFNSSPLGSANFFFKMYKDALKFSDEWYTIYRTQVNKDSPNEDGSPVFSDADVERAKATGDAELVLQEMRASWQSGDAGSYYAKQLAQVREAGNITIVPWDKALKVYTVMDLGISDSTAVIWAQRSKEGYLSVIEAVSENGRSLQSWIKEILERPYDYARDGHYAPHDIAQRELTTGKTRLEIARNFGINFRIVPSLALQDGISAVRSILPITRFDADKCKDLLEALGGYARSHDPKRNVWSNQPIHNWASHYADAFRYLAIISDDIQNTSPRMKIIESSGISQTDPTGCFGDDDPEDLARDWNRRGGFNRDTGPTYIDERNFDRPYIGYGEHLSQTRRYEDEE